MLTYALTQSHKVPLQERDPHPVTRFSFASFFLIISGRKEFL